MTAVQLEIHFHLQVSIIAFATKSVQVAMLSMQGYRAYLNPGHCFSEGHSPSMRGWSYPISSACLKAPAAVACSHGLADCCGNFRHCNGLPEALSRQTLLQVVVIIWL